MIDVAVENERNLKNVRQIGNPCEDDKIYIEDTAYKRVHAEDYADKRIFIFMGHTECENNRYTTFVEAAIPVPDITFQQNIPQWSSHAWSDIFQEIRRAYDNSIIVGWAMDHKGFSPQMTPELESVHREQFGGAHQVLFLMDSVEGEERFYMNKGNSLQQKEGFFVYYDPVQRQACEPEVTVEVPGETVFRGGKSRLLLGGSRESEQSVEVKEERTGGVRGKTYAAAVAVFLLAGLAGIGFYQNRIKLSNLENAVSVMGSHLEMLKGENNGNTEEDTETLGVIPVRKLPAGEIQQADDAAEESRQTERESSERGADDIGSEAAETSVIVQEERDKGEADRDGGDQESQENKENDGDRTADADVTVPEYYIVQQGDTLTGIARKFYGSLAYVEKVAKLNQLEDYDHIMEGQKLLLP